MDIYTLLVTFLLLLAVFDLMVGVSNDASNFLSSAIGSKVATFQTIMLFAATGVIIGATFSGGMMDIARNGLFNPEKFYFSEIIWIFVGVMIADVILLDIFNKFGLPTSTTVSIVFDLLGASLAMAIHKISVSHNGFDTLSEYINTDKALAIIAGILISVVIAFVAGVLIQWLVRVLFTFNFKKTYKYFGSVFGGIALTSIIFFMLLKGAKGASFMKPEYNQWIAEHTFQLILICFVGFTILLQTLMWLFKANIFKIIILVGTFALAMAFAGNDLVNFIGVPLAGLESYQIFGNSGVADDALLMDGLREPVSTPTYFLMIAGLIMALTLMFSRRAKKVIDTSVNLSRKDASEEEQFGSTLLARSVVRLSLNVSKFFSNITPTRWKRNIDKRFRPAKTEEDVAFDQVRASVNLVVASILIAMATSLKLPLSTTYVTFMVAMGSSLADRAWDRETAVYRITGVFTVISGWFITALCACTLSCIITSILIWGNGFDNWFQWIPLSVCLLLVVVLVFGNIFFKKGKSQEQDEQAKRNSALLNAKSVPLARVFENCDEQILTLGSTALKGYKLSLSAFLAGKRKTLKSLHDDIYELSHHTKELKNTSYKVISRIQGESVESTQYYIQVVDAIREIGNSVQFIYKPAFEYLDNNHSPFIPTQIQELTLLKEETVKYLEIILDTIRARQYESSFEPIRHQKKGLLEQVSELQKAQLKRIKKQEVSTKNSILYLNFLTETKNLILFSSSILKTNRKFYNSIVK